MSSSDPTRLPASQTGQLRALVQALRQIPAEHRAPILGFWRSVREGFNQLEAELTRLRQVLGSDPVERPPTTQSVIDARAAADVVHQELWEDSSRETLRAIHNLPVDFARSQLQRIRSATRRNDLDCWMTDNVAAHETGYVKVNLRNTQRPGGGGKIGVSPWAHQLAIVAKGRGARLQAVAGGGFNVSHLCHNAGCFNPEHVDVEEAEVNRARNSCQTSVVFTAPDGTTFHPCPHHSLGSLRRSCILPRINVQNDGRFRRQYLQALPGGEGLEIRNASIEQAEWVRLTRR